jgi:hypothetical protein
MSKRFSGSFRNAASLLFRLIRLVFDHLLVALYFPCSTPPWRALAFAPSTIPFATHNILDPCFILNHVFAYYLKSCAISTLSEHRALGPHCLGVYDVMFDVVWFGLLVGMQCTDLLY